MDTLALTMKVRSKAYELGFDGCGFSKAVPLDKEAFRLEAWLNENRHSSMGWMERNFEKRIDPRKLVPGSKSVISVIAGYRFKENEVFDQTSESPKIAKYARGRDYHKVFKGKLKRLFKYTETLTGEINGRFFVDSAPVMDKAWAERSGLGWIGKNGNLLNKNLGSWFLIGEMIIDVPFVYDTPVTDHCGTCTDCIEACPTDAIYEPYRIDSKRCISYLTIELKDKMPDEYKNKLSGWMFGCDICQDVCPWNRDARYGRFDDLKPRDKILYPKYDDWRKINREDFESTFEGSAVRRAKFNKFIDNARAAVQTLK